MKVSVKPREAAGILEDVLPSRLPVMIWGQPGIGKSDIVRQTAKKLGRPVTDVRAVLLDPVDLRGLPHVNGDGRAHWCPPAFLPYDPAAKNIIFLDELAQAPAMTQAACLQLMLDRQLGEYTLPDDCLLVAASNRQSDRAGAHRLITPLLNRFVHLHLEPSFDDWKVWALCNSIDARVLAFLNFKPQAMCQFDPKSADESFPTPRSWAFVSRVIAKTDPTMAVIAGCVGSGAAAEFMAFVKYYRELPDMDELMADPDHYPLPKGDREPSVAYALCGALVERLRSDPACADKYGRIASRMEPEFAMLSIRDGMACERKLQQVPAVRKWLSDNRDLMLAD